MATIFGFIALPLVASASILSLLGVQNDAPPVLADAVPLNNSQTFPLPQPAVGPSDNDSSGDATASANTDASVLALANGTLSANVGPLGTEADLTNDPSLDTDSDNISVYVVKAGDSLPLIAQMFGVSVNTIRWANDLNIGDVLSPGQTLVILPISGINYTVAPGDTLKSIAKKFKGDADEIGRYNGLESDSVLVAGTTIIIPDGEGGETSDAGTISQTQGNASVSSTTETSPKKSKTSSQSQALSGIASSIASLLPKDDADLPIQAYGDTRYVPHAGDTIDLGTYFIRPVKGCIETQGLHGYDAVDIGCPIGTPIMAAADGTIIIAKSSGWNGGYGKYVAIKHPNGTETVYGHMSKVLVAVGQAVTQGEKIGLVGMTGEATGPHVHFEVRGAMNPLGKNPDYGL